MPSVTLHATGDSPAGSRVRYVRAFRNVAPRVAAVLPGVICRDRPFDYAGVPQIFLTFDDGPFGGATPRLLDALQRNDAPATHFLVGSRAAHDTGLMDAMVAAGHTIGNHGWAHEDAWHSTGAAANLERGRKFLEDALGRRVRDTRPPFGRLTPSIYRWARTGRHRLVLWDLMPGEFLASAHAPTLAKRLVRLARPGSIVALHDGPPVSRTAAILDIVVPMLRNMGWRFSTL